MPNNLLDEIRNTNLTTINDSSEIDQQSNERNVREPHSQLRLNNALVAKVLEDIIVEHCSNYNNEQSQELMNDVQNALHQVRISILR
tara:strand:- start:905 stop:1165 length:261 start_codon:yes stop_codon:yes gene_type:complete